MFSGFPFAPNRWLVLVGPTAVGKSAVAERLALDLGAEIVVADSRQIYRGMDIGMDKPSLAAQRRVRRHLIDLVDPTDFFSAGEYRKVAERQIAKLEEKGQPFLIEGGTGLYLRALLDGLWEGPPADWALRQQMREDERQSGEGTLHRRLLAVDPATAEATQASDLPKIIRALEVYRVTGQPLSAWHARHRATRQRRPSILVGLRRERDALYRRVETRVEQQLAAGLVEETRRFAALPPDLPSMRGLGYRQTLPYLLGARSYDESVALLKRDTRRYAKRQMTWFGADPNIHWFDLEDEETPPSTAARILAWLRAGSEPSKE